MMNKRDTVPALMEVVDIEVIPVPGIWHLWKSGITSSVDDTDEPFQSS